jgi:hypothetical protein
MVTSAVLKNDISLSIMTVFQKVRNRSFVSFLDSRDF